MSLLFFGTFGITLFQPPVMIFRFAILQDKSIPGSPGEKRIAAYCKKVTIVWICFFAVNGSIAAFTIFSGSDTLWSVYNGGISYILMGILFVSEYMVRKQVQKSIPKTVPLTSIKSNSRKNSDILCYEGVWSEALKNPGKRKTWGDFLEGTAILRNHIQNEASRSDKWLLYCDDYWLFLLAFASLLQCGKEILLTANTSPEYIAEIRDDTIPFLTDLTFPEGHQPANYILISSVLSVPPCSPCEEIPKIVGEETSIILFTSGSTGKPKAVKQRLTEFENDNKFILSKWGDEIISRKLCATVSQHHIYGLLFTILLPFTAGVPFKRERIQVPEEFKKLEDARYLIITVPAFLKRAVEIDTELNLKSPWIFTSGGALPADTAEKTDKVFGFWPVEVYGSTETSGIAWRQSKNGLEWIPFDNAQISKNKDGCLVIRSPYIKDPAGFETADLAEILDDGRFRLLGRADSVVKIEEKRISLTEIEERIIKSGLTSYACVIPMEAGRQYLAAAVVFNDDGKERFKNLEKYEINNYWKDYLLKYFENQVIPKKWRYPRSLPMDSQGKIKREDIRILFDNNEKYNKEKVIEKTDNSITLEFSVPGTSPYFDGHFPEFQLLPGVAQADIIIRFASKYFGTGVTLQDIKRVKFTAFVLPSLPLVLNMEKKDNKIIFKLNSPDRQTVYSSGTFVLNEA